MAQELELKILTEPAEFARCLALLQAHTGQTGDRYVQVNYYFDTPDLALSSTQQMLRVRSKKNRLWLQFKQKRQHTADRMMLCDEYEAPLDAFPRRVDPSAYFPEAPSQDCALLGELVTLRTDFVLPGAVVSLDENVYWGKTDYELEIEGERDAIEAIAAFLAPKGEIRSGNGKYSRFIQEYQNGLIR